MLSIRRRLTWVAACALFLGALALAAAAPGAASAATADYVIEISVDGLGSSYLQGMMAGGGLPNFSRLQAEGAWTLNARNDDTYTVTLPDHTTMLTGRAVAGPDGHNYTDDGTPAAGVTIHSNKGSYVASVFDVVHDNGLSTALFANKSKFVLYQGSYDAAHGAPDATGPDNGTNKIDYYTYAGTTVANLVPLFVDAMNATPYQFSFLHMRDPDTVGHASGWGTAAYNDSLETCDAALGSVFTLVDTNPVLQGRTAIILTADHGGRGLSHGTVTAPLNYTIPLFVWGSGVTPNTDLYAINAATRLDPGTARAAYADALQPLRNGDLANLGLNLLGLGPVPGSTINRRQDLTWQGSAAPPVIIAHTVFNEAPEGAANWTPGAGDTELGFATTSTGLGTGPVAATYTSQTSPLRLRMEAARAETTFAPVDFSGRSQVSVSVEVMLKSATYADTDGFTVSLTNGTESVTLAGFQGSALNALPKGSYLHFTGNVPAGWTSATLKAAATASADAVDFDNIYFAALPDAPATLQWAGGVDNTWDADRTANWTSGGWAWRARDGDSVILGDAAGAVPLNLGGTVRPGAVLVNNPTADIVLGGQGFLAGAGGLTKLGAASLTVATANSYSGETRIGAGTLIVAATGALGASAVRLGDPAGAEDAALLVSGAFTVDRPITVQDGGSPASLRTLGGVNTAGRAIFSGAITLEADLALTAAPGGEVELAGMLDNAAGCAITKVGEWTVIFDGPQIHGPGALLSVEGGIVELNTDAGSAGANLSILVTGAEVNFGYDQHLDTLSIGPGGVTRFTGARVVVLNHLVIDGLDLGAMTLTPEPATLGLVAVGVLGALVRRRRR